MSVWYSQWMSRQYTDKEFSHWWSSSVTAFDPGDWMQDLLRMSAQIEMRNKARLYAHMDERTREASTNIRLPDDV